MIISTNFEIITTKAATKIVAIDTIGANDGAIFATTNGVATFATVLLEMVITNSATKTPSNSVFNITVRSMVLTKAKGKKG